MKGKHLIGLVILIAILSTACATIFFKQITIHTVGKIETIGINAYQDAICTIPLTEINWGMIAPNETKTYVGYMKNEGNVNVTLSMTNENYVPQEASSYLVLTWNCFDIVLTPNQTVEAIFSLHISNDITNITDFAFNIVITGTEV